MKSDKDMGSILGPEFKIDGNVNVSGSLLIYGTVNGNIESKGSVRTAKGSRIKGDIIGRKCNLWRNAKKTFAYRFRFIN